MQLTTMLAQTYVWRESRAETMLVRDVMDQLTRIDYSVGGFQRFQRSCDNFILRDKSEFARVFSWRWTCLSRCGLSMILLNFYPSR